MMMLLVSGVCAVLALGLAVAAWRRPDLRHRGARVLASVLAVAALGLLAYPPWQTTAVPPAEAILLTDRYQADTLRALVRRLGPATRVWRYRPDTLLSTPDTPIVARLGTLRELRPALRRLHVLGAGLPEAALPELGALRLIRHTPPAFTGFRAAYWNRRLELGQPLEVEGYFASSARTPVWVRLQAAGTIADSVRLPRGHGTFRLRYTPKATGRLVATLSAGPGAALLGQEPVPAEVQPTRLLRLLLLAATPSFELKFLKNHLAAQQHAVAWRAGISRGLTQTEFSNQPATDLSRLTPALLSRYDALLADASTLASLSAAETQVLQAAQRNTGLGLLVLAEAGAAKTVLLPTSIRVVAQPGTVAGLKLRRLKELAASAVVPATLQLTGTARLLVSATGPAQPVAAAQRVGLGTVVVATLSETYPWLLQNTASLYNRYWSRLLTAAARPAASSAHWTFSSAWPRPGLPVTLQLSATTRPTRAPLVSGATGQPLAQLPLQHDVRLLEWSTATYWPTEAGWQQVQRPGQPSQWVYVFNRRDWLGPQQQAWATAALSPSAGMQSTEAATVAVAWPAGWFFALFVLAAGFLWMEEKL